ncbi:MAG: hypothetical protein F7C33_05725 [Desulfurococcales archaeon]|nr:hypothetical protein [Desulfurococcales archaeon]
MSRYTRAVSRSVTRYVPPIALLLSLAGVGVLCDALALIMVSLPYALLVVALVTQEFKASTKIALIILYLELLLVLIVKHG